MGVTATSLRHPKFARHYIYDYILLLFKGSWESRHFTEKLSSHLKPDDLVFFPATATSPLLTS